MDSEQMIQVLVYEWIKVEQIVEVKANADGEYDEEAARLKALEHGAVDKPGNTWEIVDSQGMRTEVVE